METSGRFDGCKDGDKIPERPKDYIHPFDTVCREHSISHRCTQFFHPWTNGQVERFNQTFKSETVKKYEYESMESLNRHLQLFVLAYNFQRRLKTLGYRPPIEYLKEQYLLKPKLFKKD